VEVIGARSFINIKQEGEGTGSFFIVLPSNTLRDRKTRLEIGLYENGQRIDRIATNFLAPVNF